MGWERIWGGPWKCGVLSPGQDAAPQGTACTPLLVLILIGFLLPVAELSQRDRKSVV